MTYEINENGVCLNPNEILVFEYKKQIVFKIFRATYKEKYIFGYVYECDNGGGQSPCSINKQFEDENAGMRWILRKAKHIIESHTQKGKTKALLQFIKAQLNGQQSLLFE